MNLIYLIINYVLSRESKVRLTHRMIAWGDGFFLSFPAHCHDWGDRHVRSCSRHESDSDPSPLSEVKLKHAKASCGGHCLTNMVELINSMSQSCVPAKDHNSLAGWSCDLLKSGFAERSVPPRGVGAIVVSEIFVHLLELWIERVGLGALLKHRVSASVQSSLSLLDNGSVNDQ